MFDHHSSLAVQLIDEWRREAEQDRLAASRHKPARPGRVRTSMARVLVDLSRRSAAAAGRLDGKTVAANREISALR